MLRELRRFNVKDDYGRLYILCEVATFIQVAGQEMMDGVPTLMTVSGLEVLPTGTPGQYRVPQVGLTVREA